MRRCSRCISGMIFPSPGRRRRSAQVPWWRMSGVSCAARTRGGPRIYPRGRLFGTQGSRRMRGCPKAQRLRGMRLFAAVTIGINQSRPLPAQVPSGVREWVRHGHSSWSAHRQMGTVHESALNHDRRKTDPRSCSGAQCTAHPRRITTISRPSLFDSHACRRSRAMKTEAAWPRRRSI